MRKVNIHHAKTHLSKLVEAAAAGEEIIIAKAGKPMVRLVPLGPDKQDAVAESVRRDRQRFFGMFKGKIKIHDNFDDPLPPDIAKAFGIE